MALSTTEVEREPTGERGISVQPITSALADLREGTYRLTLFVSGASNSSSQAITNVRTICDTHLSGRYHLGIVDVNQEPVLAEEHNVLATPTLVKDHPLPARMLVGDMSDHPRVLVGLDIRADTAGVNSVDAENHLH